MPLPVPVLDDLQVAKVPLSEIQHLRALFLHERNFQFVHDKCHLYGWADTYALSIAGSAVGYGAVWGRDKREDRDCIFEFYLTKPWQKLAGVFFAQFAAYSAAPFAECQTNDPLLFSMIQEQATNITAEAILFKDEHSTSIRIPGLELIEKTGVEKPGNYDKPFVLIRGQETLGTGGLMLNYNFPYADLYYEVDDKYRGNGFGSFMVQELKTRAYGMGRFPVARCNIANKASKATLLKAGFAVCGYLLNGVIRQ